MVVKKNLSLQSLNKMINCIYKPGSALYEMRKPVSVEEKSEWKWRRAAEPEVVTGAGVVVEQNLPRLWLVSVSPSRTCPIATQQSV